MRLKSLGCGVCLAAGAVAACLLATELSLRFFFPQPLLHDPDAFDPDPVLGARLRPGFRDRVVTTEFSSTWTINGDGYRGPRAGERGPAGLRVAALGDSFTFGYGVEEEQAWPRVLESLLNEDGTGAARWEVLNLGVGGYGTWEEAGWLAEKWEALRPGLVVLAFYPGNDPIDNLRARERTRSTGGGAASDRPDRREALKRWLGSRSHAYSLISTRAGELLVRLGLRRLIYPFEMDVLLRDAPAGVESAWEATHGAFARLSAFARERGLRVVVVIVPMKHQVSPRSWERLLRYYGGERGADAFDLLAPQRRVREICEREGLEVLDLLEGLRAAAGPSGDARDLYWPRDQHFNARGHAAAARLIAQTLEGLAPRMATPPRPAQLP